MARLNQRQKLFLVERTATYTPHKEILAQFREHYGLELTLQQCANYDASTVAGRRDLSAELRDVFDGVRARFLADVSAVPIASKAYRLASWQRMLEKAEARGNTLAWAKALEGAEKCIGDYFSNRRVLELPEGVPAFVVRREAGPDPRDEGAPRAG